MFFTRCKKCGFAVCVNIAPDGSDAIFREPAWHRGFPCIVPLCGGIAERMELKDLGSLAVEPHVIQPEVYYRAIQGFGPPLTPAPIERVVELLTTQRITGVSGFEVGQPPRTVVEAVALEGGAILHFAQSSHGACVYYVEEPGPPKSEMFNEPNAVSPSGGLEVSEQDRGEARRAVDGAETEAAASGQADALEGGRVPSVPTPSEL